LKTK